MTLYIPAHFRVEDRRALIAFIRDNAFGTLVSGGAGAITVSHIPFIVEGEGDGPVQLLGHVARANPHWKELEAGGTSLAIFQGPHAYVSPTWYENHPSVPTWNYAVVHAQVRARLMDEAGLRELLQRLSAQYEAGRPSPWRMEDLAPEYVAMMLKAIVGFTLQVERLEGKFKLSQNRPGADAARVAAALEGEGEGALAALMRAHPPARKG
jgi:transcriptional regulator